MSSRSRSNNPLENLQDAANKLAELRQRWNDRLTFETCSISEEYSKGRIAITLEIHVASGHSYHIQYAAIPDAKRAIAHDHSAATGGPNNGIDVVQLNDIEDGDKETMFIVDVQTVEGTKKGIPSRVRAYLIGQHRNDVIRSLQYSLTEGFYKFVPVVPHSKRRPACRFLADVRNEFDVGNIESGPQVMNSIPQDQWKFARRFLSHLEFKKIAPGRIFLDTKAAKVGLDEFPNQTIKLRDVLIGPFDL